MLTASLSSSAATFSYLLIGHFGHHPTGRVQPTASPQNPTTNNGNSRSRHSSNTVSARGGSLGRPTASRGQTRRPVTRSTTRRRSSNGNSACSMRHLRPIVDIESSDED
jgi:hypothetical protein